MNLRINPYVTVQISDREDLIPALVERKLIPTSDVHAVWMGDTVYLYQDNGTFTTLTREDSHP